MQRVRKKKPEDLEELLAFYDEREAKYTGPELDQRRTEFETAYGMNRLEGAGSISDIETRIAELWITGRVTDKEYIDLCDFDVIRTGTRFSPSPRG